MNPPIILESIIFVKLIDLESEILILDNIIDFKSSLIGEAVITVASLISLCLL